LDPNGYTIKLLQESFDSRDNSIWTEIVGRSTSPVVPTGGSVEVRVRAGTYVVALRGVAANCTPAVPSWPISVAGGATTEASFAVSCTPMPTARLAPGTQLAFVRDGQIWRVNSDGTGIVRLTAGPGDADPAWSPDGRRIAFSRETATGNASSRPRSAIFIMDADGSNVVQLTASLYDREPTWSPDGKRIAFASLCDDGVWAWAAGCLHVVDADGGSANRARLGLPSGAHSWPAWSPDGTHIAFVSDDASYDERSDIYLAAVGDSKIIQATITFGASNPSAYYQPAWSPDGRMLAVTTCRYSSQFGEACDVVILGDERSRDKTLTSMLGRGRPTWSPDGRTIAFASGGSIQWIRADGSERGLIVAEGKSPAWRP
jgi:TolB protein